MEATRLDQIIGLSRAVLDRLDRGDTLSQILAQARAVAELAGDQKHVCWLDFEIYGVGSVPGQKTPLKTAEEREGFALFWQLHAVQDARTITVRDAVERWDSRAEYDPKNKNFLLVHGIASIETMIQTYKEPDEYTAAWNPDRALQFHTLHMDHISIIQRVRDYLYRFISGIWVSATEEKRNVELLGPDYRLVIQNLDALETGVGQQLLSALGLLRSDNPADWSLAALGCRNVILELGRTLFPSKDETYHSELLQKSLDLKGEREKNRLSAFIDWHWRQAEEGAKKQLERLPALVERIYSKGSQGKQRIRHAEAQQLVVDAFDLVSSLDALVGLEPVQVKPSNAG